jgi:hypothetical protein
MPVTPLRQRTGDPAKATRDVEDLGARLQTQQRVDLVDDAVGVSEAAGRRPRLHIVLVEEALPPFHAYLPSLIADIGETVTEPRGTSAPPPWAEDLPDHAKVALA